MSQPLGSGKLRAIYIMCAAACLLSGCNHRKPPVNKLSIPSEPPGVSDKERSVLQKIERNFSLRYDFDTAMDKLRSSDSYERLIAVSDLGMYPVEASFVALANALKSEDSDDVRWRIKWSLRSLSEDYMIEPVLGVDVEFKYWDEVWNKNSYAIRAGLKEQLYATLHDRRWRYHSFFGYPERGKKMERREPPTQSEMETMMP